VNTHRSFLNAVKWSFVSEWGEKSLSVLFGFVLAAILGPRNFGAVVIAGIYITIIRIFLDQGLACALIQKKGLADEHINAVFWMNMALGLVLSVLSLLGAQWWAGINHAPEIRRLIEALSVTIPIEALSVVPRALIQRDMDFKSLSLRANASVFISGIVGVLLAYEGFGAWALVWQQILAATASVPLLWMCCPWRPRWSFSWNHLRGLLAFSTSNFAAQLALLVEAQTAPLLLGVFLGPEAVGLYRFADRIVSTVIAATTSAIQSVSLPEFARLHGRQTELQNSVVTCIRYSAILTLPALSGLAVLSRPLIQIVGRDWLPATDVLIILSVSGMAFVLAFFTGPFLQAAGNPLRLAALEWARAILGMILFIMASYAARGLPLRWQLIAVASSRVLLAAGFILPFFMCILLRASGVPFRLVAGAVMPAAAAASSIVVSALCLEYARLIPETQYLMRIVAGASLGAVAGAITLFRTDRDLRVDLQILRRRTMSLTSSDGSEVVRPPSRILIESPEV